MAADEDLRRDLPGSEAAGHGRVRLLPPVAGGPPGEPVALTTGFGYDVAHSIVKARAEGMKHVLFKPFRQDQVVKAVHGRPGHRRLNPDRQSSTR